MKKFVWLSTFCGLFWMTANAAYNANMVGTVVDVLTYPGSAGFYFRLNNQPTSHPSCNPAYFVVSETDDGIRSLMYARLLTAFATEKPLNIGFDNQGECGSGGYMRVHRIG